MYINLALATASIERAFFAQQKVLTDYAGQLETAGSASGTTGGGRTYTLNLTVGKSTLTTSTSTNPQSFLDEIEAAQRRSQ